MTENSKNILLLEIGSEYTNVEKQLLPQYILGVLCGPDWVNEIVPAILSTQELQLLQPEQF